MLACFPIVWFCSRAKSAGTLFLTLDDAQLRKVYFVSYVLPILKKQNTKRIIHLMHVIDVHFSQLSTYSACALCLSFVLLPLGCLGYCFPLCRGGLSSVSGLSRRLAISPSPDRVLLRVCL